MGDNHLIENALNVERRKASIEGKGVTNEQI